MRLRSRSLRLVFTPSVLRSRNASNASVPTAEQMSAVRELIPASYRSCGRRQPAADTRKRPWKSAYFGARLAMAAYGDCRVVNTRSRIPSPFRPLPNPWLPSEAPAGPSVPHPCWNRMGREVPARVDSHSSFVSITCKAGMKHSGRVIEQALLCPGRRAGLRTV